MIRLTEEEEVLAGAKDERSPRADRKRQEGDLRGRASSRGRELVSVGPGGARCCVPWERARRHANACLSSDWVVLSPLRESPVDFGRRRKRASHTLNSDQPVGVVAAPVPRGSSHGAPARHNFWWIWAISTRRSSGTSLRIRSGRERVVGKGGRPDGSAQGRAGAQGAGRAARYEGDQALRDHDPAN